jgi:ferredoxin
MQGSSRLIPAKAADPILRPSTFRREALLPTGDKGQRAVLLPGNAIIQPMSADGKAVGMVPDELKFEPKSTGISTPRKKKPKELAVITECCTGCAGSPACVEYCPVEDCMFWVPDEDHPPFGRIQVDPILCIGCKKCTSKGPDGCFLDGCPWDAIVMVETIEVEKEVGAMPI